MGAVYLAKDRNLGDAPRAVKEMVEAHLDPAQHEKAIGDFKRESLLLTALEHPSIPTIYDYFYDDTLGRFYLVMKFVSGGDLASRLRTAPGGRIDEKTVAEWSMQAADVLEYLHSRPKPIIYRYLSRQIDDDGNTGLVILSTLASPAGKRRERRDVGGNNGLRAALTIWRTSGPRQTSTALAQPFFLLTGRPSDNLCDFDFTKNRARITRRCQRVEKIPDALGEYQPQDRLLPRRDARRARDSSGKIKADRLVMGCVQSQKRYKCNRLLRICGGRSQPTTFSSRIVRAPAVAGVARAYLRAADLRQTLVGNNRARCSLSCRKITPARPNDPHSMFSRDRLVSVRFPNQSLPSPRQNLARG